MVTGAMGRIAVFCSYAREDDAWRQDLEAALRPLRDERIIDDWYDSRIQPGMRWNHAIGAYLLPIRGRRLEVDLAGNSLLQLLRRTTWATKPESATP